MFIIFDTETTGLPKNFNAPVSDSDNWPRLVQLAWQIHDEKGDLVEAHDHIIKPEGFKIPYNATKIHGITNEKAEQEGVELLWLLEEFNRALAIAEFVVGHSIQFDLNIMGAEYYRKALNTPMTHMTPLDTMDSSINYCQLPGGKGGGYKRPTLTELHYTLFQEKFDEAHNATADVEATARCFLELARLDVISPDALHFTPEQIRNFKLNNPDVVQPAGVSVKAQVKVQEQKTEATGANIITQDVGAAAGIPYSHMHVHTQYSILDGAAKINSLVKKASADNMKALAITDHGNMFGAKDFHQTIQGNNGEVTKALKKDLVALKEDLATEKVKLPKEDDKEKRAEIKAHIESLVKEISDTEELRKCSVLKPIIGCEFYVAPRGMHIREDKSDGKGHHLILLAKNRKGYENLMKMTSEAYLNGFYYHPRIDKALLREYKEGLIALSACLGGEVARTIMNQGEEQARKVVEEYKEMFGDDYYLEMQRHPSEDPRTKNVFQDQTFVNGFLKTFSKEYNIKLVATNDVHFVNREDAPAHDRLICLSTGKDLDDENRMRYTTQEWMKTQDEMRALFSDIPEALNTTNEIVEKIEEYDLNRKAIMPDFEIPEGFSSYDEYLRHVTYEGAHMRWGEFLDEITTERLDFELETIKNMGFPSYFLIVWDFLKAARNLGVSVGPGRGSAAGSAVAYALRITEIDPIKYDLLFERFLNPDRISMPDIDIDFDDDGRSKILQWVVEKYGKTRVAHIITFGSMAAKSAIKDVARVQRLPLAEADRLSKLVPEKPGMSLKKAFKESSELQNELDHGTPEIQSVLKYAQTLEGSVRNIGTHACGIIIGKDDLENYVPITTAKDSELTYVTQYDGGFVEDIGLLKMDFLGLKTLSIIKDAVKNVKLSKGIDVDIENVPLDDAVTYELYSRGETTGLFQFESPGMKKHLRDLKPSRFEDLIAMNALYRPGPMEYIPSFIRRKHGEEEIKYDIPDMKEYLEETYGITVYQEQVMRLSRTLGNFTRGQSDSLRKAMGKKKKKLMEELKVKFFEGCQKNGHDPKVVEKIWNDWEAFAKYAFNKSHATCYSYVSYQTAYLKAHYPAEFMAAVLSRNMNSIEKVTFFIDECQRMGIKVLGPDVNESFERFTVNQNGEIRFGMTAVKGMGEAAVESLIKERDTNGSFLDIFDLVKRSDLRAVNKKSLEALALAGGFDGFKNAHRAQYFKIEDDKNTIFLEKIVRYGQQYQTNLNSAQASLFGDSAENQLPTIQFPEATRWGHIEKLKKEKEVIGFFLSGHPLDDYKVEIKHLCNATLKELEKPLDQLTGKEYRIAGIVAKPTAPNLITKKGKPYGRFTLEDYEGSKEFFVFDKIFNNHKEDIASEGTPLMMKIRVTEGKYPDQDGNKKYFMSIEDMIFLGDVMNDMDKKVEVAIDFSHLNNHLIDELVSAADNNPGKNKVDIRIDYAEEQMKLKLPGRTKKVDFVKFANILEDMDGITYKLS